MTTPTTYDEVPYLTRPRRATHPDTFAVVATLMGMTPTPVTTCRVLELGCGTGGNLTPMAACLPESRFVGIDLSSVQIEMANHAVRELGLTNIEYQAGSVTDIGADLGSFDYIIAHGLYSWVPAHVQDAILTVCSRNLTPNGVAFVSYNTYPGWHFRGPVREMVGWHVRDIASPRDKVAAARGFLEFLAKAIPDADPSYAGVVRSEAERMAGESDHYLFHEHLEADNTPLYFHEFVRRAAAQGLQFLGEAGETRRTRELSEEVRNTIAQASATVTEQEQYFDFLWNRTFRRTLLCPAAVPLARSPGPDDLDRLLVSSATRPMNPDPDLSPATVEEFVSLTGTTMSTNSPIVKATLSTLARVWPLPLAAVELATRVSEATGSVWAANPIRGRRALAQTLTEFYFAGLVDLHTHVPAFVTRPSAQPVGYAVARWQAGRQRFVTSVRHQEVLLEDPIDRFVLPLLDGTRDHSAITGAVVEATRAGQLPATGDTRPSVAVADALARLGGSAVLIH